MNPDSRPVTKGDLRELRSEFELLHESLISHFAALNASLDRFGDGIRAELWGFHAVITKRIDDAVAEHENMDREKVIADWLAARSRPA